MHWLRHRISEERKEEQRANEAMRQHFERRVPYLQHLDEQDERMFAGGRTPRSSANAERRGIERLFRLESEAYQVGHFDEASIRTFTEEYGLTPAEMRNHMWADMIDEHYGTQPSHSQVQPNITIDHENRRDIRDNYLYELWIEQLRQASGIRTYPVFALFTATKAAVDLVTSRSSITLSTFYDGPMPDRDHLIAARENPYFTGTVAEYMGLLEEPGMLELTEALLLRYSDIVRSERGLDTANADMVFSPLPDDPGTTSLETRYEVPEYIRIENAVQAYTAGEGTSVELANRYKIGEKRFQNVLRERGLLAKRGGDRRKGK